MRNAELRDAAAAVILERHPELAGRVVFDYTAFDITPHVMGINLVVALTYEGYRWVHDNANSISMIGRGGEYGRYGYMARILDHYCTHEPEGQCDFVCGGYKWLIGDGDDSLAVSELEPGVATVWVRSWGDKA